MKKVMDTLDTCLLEWDKMQSLSGDEGAEAAERFEQKFYEFIAVLKKWYNQLETPPETIEEAEELVFIQDIQEKLPGPLVLNFLNELELIIDQIDEKRFD